MRGLEKRELPSKEYDEIYTEISSEGKVSE